MNAYSENLHYQVLDILQNQQSETEKLTSMANAQLFTLYYASGAAVTAAAVLQAKKDKQAFAALVKKQTAESYDICSNLLTSDAQLNQSLKQSVTNAAVAAADTQVAANAIVKLAGDIGGIYSMISAADINSDISKQTKALYTCMNQTAYDAEKASQLGMEASFLTAAVAGNALLDKAKDVNTAMAGLMKTVIADYDTIASSVLADEARLLTAATAKRQAAGVYTDIETTLKAAGDAHTTVNRELNLGLTARFTTVQSIVPQINFEVSFNLIKSPFAETDKTALFPVKDYCIFLVKEKNKLTFTNEYAESILKQFPHQYITVNDLKPDEPEVHKIYNCLQITNADKTSYVLTDTDGDEITTGVNYVVFLLAVYQEAYKKYLSVFDDFLSAPSQACCLTHLLKPAQDIKIGTANTGWPKSISFSVEENPAFAAQAEYRCILLPQSEKHKGLNEIDFIFNIFLAAEVHTGAYTVAEKSSTDLNEWRISLNVSTTDNFGNVLKSGKHYIPVIFSVFAGKNEDVASFTNTWTGYDKPPLLYIN